MPRGDPLDPKTLIEDAYKIEGIPKPECRSIFLDWALSIGADMDPKAAIQALLARHSDQPADHPMTQVLIEGLAQAPAKGRRGGRAARLEK